MSKNILWTDSEYQLALNMFRNGLTSGQIAIKLKRPEPSVRYKLYRASKDRRIKHNNRLIFNGSDAEFTRDAIIEMDAKFQRSMRKAILKGLEKCPVGVVSDPSTRQPVVCNAVSMLPTSSALGDL